jgi:alpha-amylase
VLISECEGQATPSGNVNPVFVHLFEWSWDDIAQECEDFLGPMGYDAVQVSPPMEHRQGPMWWTRYQPVSYKLVSRSGNETQFRSMTQRCKDAGVKIYVDVVSNHMAEGSGTGTAGTAYGNRAVPGLYSQDDFHHDQNDKGSNCVINNYFSQQNVQSCDLSGEDSSSLRQSRLSASLANLLTLSCLHS